MLDSKVKELLPDLIKEAMEVLTETANATDEITLPVTLAVATFATQGLADGYPIMWNRCAISNYFCVLVPSGGLKTSISDSVLEGARRFENDNRSKAEEAEIEYQIQMKQYEKEIKERVKQKVVVPGITPAVINPFTKLTKPKHPRTARYMAGKFTLNGILNALKGVPHFGIFNSDAAEFFNSHAFKDPTSSIELVSALSRLWSGEQIDKLTGIEDIVTGGKRTTALFMLQQQLAGFFVNSQFKDQGFTNRMLITQSEKITKKRADFADMKNIKKITTDERLTPFNNRVYELLALVDDNQKKPQGKGLLALRQKILEADERDVNVLLLETHQICDTDNSFIILQQFYNDMVDKMEDKSYEEYQNFISRAYEHCVRLATVLSLFDKKDKVTEREVECSVGLMYYFIDQRMNLTIDGTIKINDIVECCEKVEKFLKDKYLECDVTKTMLNNYGPNQYRKMKVVHRDEVLEELRSREVIELDEVNGIVVIRVKQN